MKISSTLTSQYWNLVWLSCTFKSTRKFSNIVVSSVLCGLKCRAVRKQYVQNVNLSRDKNVEMNIRDYVKIEKKYYYSRTIRIDN